MILGIPWWAWLGFAVFASGVMLFIGSCIADSVRPPTVNEEALKDANRRLRQERQAIG